MSSHDVKDPVCASHSYNWLIDMIDKYLFHQYNNSDLDIGCIFLFDLHMSNNVIVIENKFHPTNNILQHIEDMSVLILRLFDKTNNLTDHFHNQHNGNCAKHHLWIVHIGDILMNHLSNILLQIVLNTFSILKERICCAYFCAWGIFNNLMISITTNTHGVIFIDNFILLTITTIFTSHHLHIWEMIFAQSNQMQMPQIVFPSTKRSRTSIVSTSVCSNVLSTHSNASFVFKSICSTDLDGLNAQIPFVFLLDVQILAFSFVVDNEATLSSQRNTTHHLHLNIVHFHLIHHYLSVISFLQLLHLQHIQMFLLLFLFFLQLSLHPLFGFFHFSFLSLSLLSFSLFSLLFHSFPISLSQK